MHAAFKRLALRLREADGAQKSENGWNLLEWKKSKQIVKRGRDAKAASQGQGLRRKHENATLAPSLSLVEAVAIIICQSNGAKVVMRANAYCHRK